MTDHISEAAQSEVLSLVATVHGQPLVQLPGDLYIPPQALKVLLENFSGPLDLLLYLIKKQNFDILQIPVAEVTRQYMQYLELMKVLAVELAAEYLLMAAILAEIKSRLLLPRPALPQLAEEIDPRAELMRRLQEYEQMKQAAHALDQLPMQGRDIFLAMTHTELTSIYKMEVVRPELVMEDLVDALRSVLVRVAGAAHHTMIQEPLSIQDRMAQILSRVSSETNLEFTDLFYVSEGRMGVVITFVAILELWRQNLITLFQYTLFGKIEVRVR